MLLPVCTLISTLTPSRRFFVVSHAILSLQLIVLTVATAVKTSFSLFLLRYTFVKNVFFWIKQIKLSLSKWLELHLTKHGYIAFLLTNYLCAAVKTFSSLFAADTLGLAFWLPNPLFFYPYHAKTIFLLLVCY